MSTFDINQRDLDVRYYGDNSEAFAKDISDLLIGKLGTVKSDTPFEGLSVCSFPTLWKNYYWLSNKYLMIEIEFYRTGFSMKCCYYGTPREKGRKNSSWYDYRKGTTATFQEKMAFKYLSGMVKTYLVSKGCKPEFKEHNLPAAEFVNWSINCDPSRHWGKWETYKDEPYHVKCNAKDRDGKVLQNGEVKFFRDYKGRLIQGKVYHNINNMWWIVYGNTYKNNACYDYFDATPEDLRKRKLAKIRRTPEQELRIKMGKKNIKQWEVDKLDLPTKENVRRKFKERWPDLSKIDFVELSRLTYLLNKELKNHAEQGNLKMSMCPINNFIAKMVDNKGIGYKGLELKVKGPYFSGREGITFYKNGDVGFCGWASSCNEGPFLKAFNTWISTKE